MKPIILLAISSVFYTGCISGNGCEDNMKTIRKYHFSGIVEGKYESKDHRTPYAIINGEECSIIFYTDLYAVLSEGDYIEKDSGNLKVTRIRNGDTADFYPICNGHDYTY